MVVEAGEAERARAKEAVMERVTFTNSLGKKLVGVLHAPMKKTMKVIVMAHGFASKKDRPRFIAMGNLFARQGFAALRFDFGGSGESYASSISVRGSGGRFTLGNCSDPK